MKGGGEGRWDLPRPSPEALGRATLGAVSARTFALCPLPYASSSTSPAAIITWLGRTTRSCN